MLSTLILSLSSFIGVPTPAALAVQSCSQLNAERITNSQDDVLRINVEGKVFTSLEFINQEGKVVEKWPMFEGVDELQWDLNTIQGENIWMVFRNQSTNTCVAKQVR